jgi:hypothetical protein
LAAALLTCAELWQAAGAWKISYDLAEPERRNQFLATFQTGVAVQSFIGPFLIIDGVLHSSLGWLGLGAVVLAFGFLGGFLLRSEKEVVAGT